MVCNNPDILGLCTLFLVDEEHAQGEKDLAQVGSEQEYLAVSFQDKLEEDLSQNRTIHH